MSWAAAVAVAALFIWFGMVLAISFIEAPLKFRAPGVTLRIGLGIGRLVFRALNAIEIALAVVVVAVALPGSLPLGANTGIAVAVLALLVQLVAVRPPLSRRSDAILAGPEATAADGTRSRVHYVYVALEMVKLVALLAAGIALLAG